MRREMSREKLLQGLDTLAWMRVCVAGDVMLDHYQYGKVERISPEAPVPVVAVEEEEYRLGGAANVARNTRSLGVGTGLIGCCGDNAGRSRIVDLLRDEDIGDGLVAVDGMATIQKTRVIAQGQQVIRIDKEDADPDMDTGHVLKALLRQMNHSAQAVILSDYGKGFLSGEVLGGLRDSEFANCRYFIDPKPGNFRGYPSPELITPNRREAELIWGQRMKTESDILSAGESILKGCGAENVLITLGEEGMVLLEASGSVYKISTQARHVYDVTGAGDTVVAVAAAAMAAGLDALHASALANIAAGIVVEEVGACTVSADQLRDHIQNKDAVFVHKWR